MILLKGKGKSTMIDISDKELNSILGSFIADTQMSKALISLDDKTFEANVIIPKGQSVKKVRDEIKAKIEDIDKMITEFKNKLAGQ